MTNRIEVLSPALQPFAHALVQVADANGLHPQVTSTLRTHAEQKALYEKFLKGESPYPASPPFVGSHEYGEAFDLVVQPMEMLPALGQVWESWGGFWGGRWRQADPIHFELPGATARAQAMGGPQAAATAPARGGIAKYLAIAADVVLGMVPGIGEVELAATLFGMGYPKSEIARFLGGPVEYFFP